MNVRIVQSGIVLRERRDGRWFICYGTGWPNLRVPVTRGWHNLWRGIRRLLSIRVRIAPPGHGFCDACGQVTEWACSDCAIDAQGYRVRHVCPDPTCRDKHEKLRHGVARLSLVEIP